MKEIKGCGFMGIEQELKYAITNAGDLDAIIAWNGVLDYTTQPVQEIQMESHYFDTAHGDLSARRWTLRQRNENQISVIGLKTPGEKHSTLQVRGEWECQGAKPDDCIETLVALGAPKDLPNLISGKPLVEICGATFLRKSLQLFLEDDTQVELAVDTGILTGSVSSMDLKELELELKNGSVKVMEEFSQKLASHFSLEIQPLSKFARAFSLVV